jgi:hypothetical protein
VLSYGVLQSIPDINSSVVILRVERRRTMGIVDCFLRMLLVIHFSYPALLTQALNEGSKYFTVPYDSNGDQIYLGITEFGETVVTHAARGSDLRQSDYLSHIDGFKILSGGLKNFLANDEREAVIPIVDDEDTQDGGGRLLGLLKVQIIKPSRLSVRRGEIIFDMNEGGLGSMLPTDQIKGGSTIFHQVSRGRGKCITGRYCLRSTDHTLMS